MQVEHHLPAMLVAVHDESKAVFGNAFTLRDVACHHEHVAEQAFVIVGDVVDGGNGLVRYDEHVHRRLRTDVAKCDHALVLVHDGRRNFPGDDLLENRGHDSPAVDAAFPASGSGEEYAAIPTGVDGLASIRQAGHAAPGVLRGTLSAGSYGFRHGTSLIIRALKLSLETLHRHLSGAPVPAYLVSGDEVLLVGEAADAIRAAVKHAGYLEREVFFIERVADWDAVRASTNNLSLFGSRKLIELRLPSGKPGTGGANAIVQLLARAGTDNVFLMLTGKLEREQSGSTWVKAFENTGAWLPVWPIELDRMPQWLNARAASQGLKLDEAAVQFIVERTEGNLLAAQQELEKLKLTVAHGTADLAAVQASIGDSARFDVFQLGEAALAGEVTRALRILAGLRSEGVEPTLALWSLAREVRNTWGTTQSEGLNARSWQRQSAALDNAKRRAARLPYARLAARISRADRMIKGQHRNGDPWDEMSLLIVEFAGRRTLPLTGTRAA